LRKFPVKIPTLWRQAFPGLVLGAIVGKVSLWLQGEPFSLPSTAPLMAVAAVMVILMYYFSPTMAGEQGIKAMNSWGIRRLVLWPEVESVTFARMYWIQPSLKVVDRAGRTYWIAKETKNLRDLHAIAVQFGGAGHPLARALEVPLYAL
jgi:hypothetical protein